MRPLDRLQSIKVKLGVVIVSTVAGTVIVLAIGFRLGWPLELRTLVAAVIALVIVQVLARGMTSPLREMSVAAKAMSRGDYARRVTASSRDEVGELARAFNAMAAELADVDRMRRDLVANVSHELRTPIGALQALLENLVDGVEPPDPAALRTALIQTERLGRLVGQLLDLSRLESGALALRPVPFPVRPLLEQATRECELGENFNARPVWLRVSVQPGDLRAVGDAERMHQVISNLLENAVRHSPTDGRVWLSAHAATAGVTTIEVADEGPGIPVAEAERVFERFHRVDAARAARDGGTGLGLAIARWIVDAHGGTIAVREREPHGCRVVVELPEITPGTGGTMENVKGPVPLAGPLKNHGTPAAAHPQRLAPPTLLTWQSHASRARAARDTGGCTTSVGPTILQRTLGLADAEVATPVWAARSILAVGLLAAGTVVGQPLGLGVALALLVLGAIAGVVRRPGAIPAVDLRVAEPRERDRWTWVWWALAAGLTCVPFLRAATWVVVPSLFAAAAVASLAVSGGVRWGQLAASLGVIWARLPAGPVLAGWAAARGVSVRGAGPVARGAVLAAALLAVFVPLLMSADAAFAQLLEDVVPTGWSLEQPVDRALVLTLFVALGGGLVYARLRPVEVAARPAKSAIGRVEARIALGALVALFGAFVALQFATLFGGQRHVLDTAGLTYAEYARSGFAQLLAVAALTFAVIGAARRWAPRERVLPAALCVLALVVCVSALRRLGLYEETYGFTRLRFAAHAALLYFAALFALVLVTRSPRAVLALTAGAVLAFALADPERRIATHNLERYERTGKVDVGYLMTLGPDATPALAGVVPPPCIEDDGIAGFNLARAAARRTSTDRRTAASRRCDPRRPTR